METYPGEFDEIFATDENDETVGFIKAIGKGKVLVLGAAMAINTLDELKIVKPNGAQDGLPLFFNPVIG